MKEYRVQFLRTNVEQMYTYVDAETEEEAIRIVQEDPGGCEFEMQIESNDSDFEATSTEYISDIPNNH